MSTILKALRRLEEEKAARADRALREEVVAAGPPVPPRGLRSLPLGAAALVLAAAVIGIGLAARPWLAGRATPPGVDSAPPVQAVAPPAPAAAAPPAPAPEPARVIVSMAPAASAAPGAAPHAGRTSALDDVREFAVEGAEEAPEEAEPRVAAAAPREPQGVPLSALPDASSPQLLGEPPAEHAAPPPAAEPSAPAPAPPPKTGVRPRAEPAASAAPKAATVLHPAAAARPAHGSGVVVARTIWHPTPERRIAVVRRSGASGEQQVHEGEVVAGLEVVKIEPSGVVFLRDGHEFRQPVGDGR